MAVKVQTSVSFTSINFHCLGRKQKLILQLSEMRLFSKLLSQTDIRKRLSIPMKSFAAFPRFKVGHTLDLQVKDESGSVWLFRFSTRKKNYLKPVFSKGWCKFVQSKNLQVGDKVKFYKDEDEANGVQFKIKAKKAVKIFGVVFGYAKA